MTLHLISVRQSWKTTIGGVNYTQRKFNRKYIVLANSLTEAQNKLMICLEKYDQYYQRTVTSRNIIYSKTNPGEVFSMNGSYIFRID